MRMVQHRCSNCGSEDTQEDFGMAYDKDSQLVPTTFICSTCGNIDNVFPDISIEQVKKRREEHFAFEKASAIQAKRLAFSRVDVTTHLLLFIAAASLLFGVISSIAGVLDILSTIIIVLFGTILFYVSYLFRKRML